MREAHRPQRAFGLLRIMHLASELVQAAARVRVTSVTCSRAWRSRDLVVTFFRGRGSRSVVVASHGCNLKGVGKDTNKLSSNSAPRQRRRNQVAPLRRPLGDTKCKEIDARRRRQWQVMRMSFLSTPLYPHNWHGVLLYGLTQFYVVHGIILDSTRALVMHTDGGLLGFLTI